MGKPRRRFSHSSYPSSSGNTTFTIRHEASFGGESLKIYLPDKQTVAYTARLHNISKPSIILHHGELGSAQRRRSQNSIVGEADIHHIRPTVDVILPGEHVALYRGGFFGRKTRYFHLWGMDFVFKPTSAHGRGSSITKDVKLVNESDGKVWLVFHRSGGWGKWGEIEILAERLNQVEIDAMVMMTVSYLQKVKKDARRAGMSGGG